MTVFNYHEEKDPNAKNFILGLMTAFRIQRPDLNFMEITDGGKNVDVSVTINGVTIDGADYLRHCVRSVDHTAAHAAKEIVLEAINMDSFMDAIAAVEQEYKNRLARVLNIAPEDRQDFWYD